MKIFGMIRCLFAAHTPNRRRVRRHDDGGYIGTCAHCGAKVKQIKRNQWVRDWRKRPPHNRNTSYEHVDDVQG